MWPLIAADFAVVLVVFIIVFVHLVLIDGRIVIIIATERLVVLHVFILGNTGRFECGCRHLSRNVSGRLCRQRSRQLDAAYWAGSTNCTEPNRARQRTFAAEIASGPRRKPDRFVYPQLQAERMCSLQADVARSYEVDVVLPVAE